MSKVGISSLRDESWKQARKHLHVSLRCLITQSPLTWMVFFGSIMISFSWKTSPTVKTASSVKNSFLSRW